MALLIFSFFAGILTVLSPCIFTLLPVILGGTLKSGRLKRAAIIIIALMISVFTFTLLLKASTSLISIPPEFWRIISGSILIFLGLTTLFPQIWSKVSIVTNFEAKSQTLLSNSYAKKDLAGDILTGASLGPVFTSCSPTFGLIIATVLPQSFAAGITYLIAYTFGLGFIMLLIATLGQRIISRLKWAVNPNGVLKKSLGVLFILIGVLIAFGIDKLIESALLQSSWFLEITKYEIDILRQVK